MNIMDIGFVRRRTCSYIRFIINRSLPCRDSNSLITTPIHTYFRHIFTITDDDKYFFVFAISHVTGPTVTSTSSEFIRRAYIQKLVYPKWPSSSLCLHIVKEKCRDWSVITELYVFHFKSKVNNNHGYQSNGTARSAGGVRNDAGKRFLATSMFCALITIIHAYYYHFTVSPETTGARSVCTVHRCTT